jgi:hypothetical protein
VPYVQSLLGVSAAAAALAQMDAPIKWQRTLEMLKRLFICESLSSRFDKTFAPNGKIRYLQFGDAHETIQEARKAAEFPRLRVWFLDSSCWRVACSA